MNLVDTHCHLQFDKLAEKIDEVIVAADKAGVKRLICVGTSVDDSAKSVDLAGKHDNVWAAVGAHPHDGQQFDYQTDPAKLAELAQRPRAVAFGEIGLDFYKDYSPRHEQEKLFRTQLKIGLSADLPIIFHVRDAWSDFWRIVADYPIERAVVHSFSSGKKQADKILERGWFIGLNGIMTFTRDQAQLDAAQAIPLERLLLETDAPFLTPEPFRGEICEPKHVAATAEFLANLRGEKVDELAEATTENAVKLFNLK
ncbi:MAG TPA: TatD family hydrolase [Candidatus Saccharimonadales bacterium]|nr:TatD family hydrolase [Candidatus Saccharimonadales bacterium]